MGGSLLVYKGREGHRKHCRPSSSFCLVCWPGNWGLGRDAGLLMKLNGEAGDKMAPGWRHSWDGGQGAQEVRSRAGSGRRASAFRGKH